MLQSIQYVHTKTAANGGWIKFGIISQLVVLSEILSPFFSGIYEMRSAKVFKGLGTFRAAV